MKKNEWILTAYSKNGIDPQLSGFVEIDSLPSNHDSPISFLYDSDITTSFYTSYLLGYRYHSINYTFSNLITVSSYILEIKSGNRFPTAWRLDVSNDGIDFTTIDERNDPLCHSKSNCDCGASTSRIFTIPTTTAKYFRLIQTEKDSCGTYTFHLSTFDLFGFSGKNNFCTFRQVVLNHIFHFMAIIKITII